MADIHMEIETCERVSTLMREIKNSLQDSVDVVSQKANAVVGSEWIAMSATDFLAEFQEIQGRLDGQLNTLEDFRSRLADAVEVAKRVSSDFG